MANFVELNDDELEKVNGGVDIPFDSYKDIKLLCNSLIVGRIEGLIEICKRLLGVGISKDTLFQMVDKNTANNKTFREEIKDSINSL